MTASASVQATLLTAAELAVAIRADYSEVIRKASAGTIPCYRWGRHPRFDLDEVKAALRQNPKRNAVRDVSRLRTIHPRRVK